MEDFENPTKSKMLNGGGGSGPLRQTISKDVQEKVINVIKADIGIRKTAKLLKMPYSTVSGIYARYKKNGRVQVKNRGLPVESELNKEDELYLEKVIAADCTITKNELQQMFRDNRQLRLSGKTIVKYLKKLNYISKRIETSNDHSNNSNNSNNGNMEDNKLKCDHQYVQLLDKDNVKIIFHQCHCQITTHRKYYWIKKNKLMNNKTNTNTQCKHISIMALIIDEEMIFYIQESSIVWSCLVHHIEFLLNYLNNNNCHISFIMDNVPYNKKDDVRYFIEIRGHELLYLPPNNAFFAPIINIFSQWKKTFVNITNTDNLEQFRIAIEYFDFLFTKDNLNNYYEKSKNNFLKFLKYSPTVNTNGNLHIVME